MMEAYTELLCKLMSTIGKLIDTPEAKEYMVRITLRDINIPFFHSRIEQNMIEYFRIEESILRVSIKYNSLLSKFRILNLCSRSFVFSLYISRSPLHVGCLFQSHQTSLRRSHLLSSYSLQIPRPHRTPFQPMDPSQGRECPQEDLRGPCRRRGQAIRR